MIVLGLMSGTSLDGVDAVAVEFPENDKNGLLRVLGHAFVPYPHDIKKACLELCVPGDNEIIKSQVLSIELAKIYAQVIEKLLDTAKLDRQNISAACVHGQTVRHHPELGFSLQLNNPSLIAELTHIDIIADLRSRDIAAGGQGAPLVPAFHREMFAGSDDRVILNLGGIANISCLPKHCKDPNFAPLGGDTGPANMLIDLWVQKHFDKPYDANGCLAHEGTVNAALLAHFKNDPYFSRSFPKSTGREYFNEAWLENKLTSYPQSVSNGDVLTTLVELTASTIVDAIKQLEPECSIIYACGGGAMNTYLLERIEHLSGIPVRSTSDVGLDPQHVEAVAFAWLGKRFLERQPGNMPTVTDAKGERILGCLYPA